MATKILVLENTEGIAELLTFSISSDFDVFSASNCEDAFSMMSRENPPLLIFDITQTDMDGIEFLCKIKKTSPQTEVITIADISMKELALTSLKYDASDFILKPVTGETLEIILERALKKLAIKKRLSPTSGDVFPSVVDTERLSAVKQVIDVISTCGNLPGSIQKSILSLHTKKGVVIKTSEEHKKLFGNLEGKKSWDIFKRNSMTPESCPAAQAFKTGSPYQLETPVQLKNGDEVQAVFYSTPLYNQNDQADMAVEFIFTKND
jgi:YesN/AraC family two-component response regulator